jgi:hypothetical protein
MVIGAGVLLVVTLLVAGFFWPRLETKEGPSGPPPGREGRQAERAERAEGALDKKADSALRHARGLFNQERVTSLRHWLKTHAGRSSVPEAEQELRETLKTQPYGVVTQYELPQHTNSAKTHPWFTGDSGPLAFMSLGKNDEVLTFDIEAGTLGTRATTINVDTGVFSSAPVLGGLVAAGTQARLIWVQGKAGVEVRKCKAERDGSPVEIVALASSLDGTRVAVGLSDTTVLVFDAVSHEHLGPRLPSPTNVMFDSEEAHSIDTLCFSADNSALWVCYSNDADTETDVTKHAFYYADLSTPVALQTTILGAAQTSVAHQSGRVLFGTDMGEIVMLDPTRVGKGNTTAIASRLTHRDPLSQDTTVARAHKGSLRGLALSRSERVLYSVATGSKEHQNEICAWNLESGDRTWEVVRPKAMRLESLSLSSDGRFLAVGTKSGRVEIWATPEF